INFLSTDAELRVHVDSLPAGWRVRIPDLRELRPRPPSPSEVIVPQVRDPQAITRKARLLKASGLVLRPGETVQIPLFITPPASAPAGTSVDVNVQGLLLPLVAGKRQPEGNGYTFHVVVR
ncbi:MAG TPA: hypothetical protein VFT21_12870, partial [Gemmatimonadaceae bacterium]|nr:hypothetical protein [Gemmatimonadaceae bacterium]